VAYSIYTDVQAEFKNITFSSSSSVKDTEVTEFITQADAYIDSRLGLKYTVPITGVESLKICKRLSIWLVTGRIKRILRVKTGVQTGEQDTIDGDLETLARNEIEMILDGLLLLSDATLATTADGFRSYAVDEDLEYTFTREDDQW